MGSDFIKIEYGGEMECGLWGAYLSVNPHGKTGVYYITWLRENGILNQPLGLYIHSDDLIILKLRYGLF